MADGSLSFEALLSKCRQAEAAERDIAAFATSNDTPTNEANKATQESQPFWKEHDFRGFAFVHHREHGLLLLKCTRKLTKPVHYQLPGGHVDDFEFEAASSQTNSKRGCLQIAARRGCARELFEETGIDVRSQLGRLRPVPLENDSVGEDHPNQLDLPNNLFKSRVFYMLEVADSDFFTRDESSSVSHATQQEGLSAAENGTAGGLMLKLSVEHAGFRFEKSADACCDLLQHHSGGKVSRALRMACTI
mmetsp:Transcript_8784/g.23717  ORF Transcript_8784/g.23717 Transcript_8784/m.23717 type:complete len:248 (-) Transcript_8784:805-1548(-)|eukprot:CAMPEP_0198134034 /NCGR_PEP_ID=MMETSP1442-20131203/59871_1 /TAXON_ID= /ORGANISM="Craspedostauros australis, Strain CCMP3328" /LENGTH=247 /DNA_ID=CAMNT_0043795169 /DNA_START=1235 /DNA_END=1978 /DNA_ORIENTATION=+